MPSPTSAWAGNLPILRERFVARASRLCVSRASCPRFEAVGWATRCPCCLSQQIPGTSHRPAEHAVSLIVIDEPLGRGVPLQLSGQPHGDVADVRDREAPLPDLRREVTLLPGFDAVEEIALLALWARVQVDLLGPDDGIEDRGGFGL